MMPCCWVIQHFGSTHLGFSRSRYETDPQTIGVYCGPEFIAKQLQRWLDQAAVGTLYIQKGSPWENGYVESFNGKLRDELLNRELFLSAPEARYVLDEWTLDYNQHRPHSSLDWKTPAAFAATLNDPAAGVVPAASLADPPVGAAPLPTAQQANQHHPILSQ